jgi:hypothetical protein
MQSLRRIMIGMLILPLLGLPAMPQAAAAQSGTRTYEVTVTNITNSKQGLSPLIIASHPPSVHAWQMGQTASAGLEKLAEEGMPDVLASEWQAIATDVQTTKAHLLPKDSIVLRITANEGDVLSAATMLIQTNDGFTGLESAALSGGDKDTMAYDAGTEENTELAADVPGPPFGGMNHGPDTTPRGTVAQHGGITGKADVTTDFNWSGPVARFTIREVETTTVDPNVPTYEVTVTNITNSKQGLSPLVIASHPASADAWQMGQMASPGLEKVAEEGMTDVLESEWRALATDVAATKAHLLPRDSITVRITAKEGDVLSAATMLIQTNDGFTGLDAVALTDGDTDTMAYDAGTEENTELAADVPGPPFGGMNRGTDTNPHQPIAMHPGIMGKADVTPDFNWSGPVARFTIKRLTSSALPSMGSGAAPSTGGTTSPIAESSEMPNMPKTGVADTSIWLVVVLAMALSIVGFAVRRTSAIRRR